MNFIPFSEKVEKQFNKMAKGTLYVVEINRDVIWERYLDAFPEGTNETLKTNREYDCTCCRHFVKNIGNVVSIINGKMVSVWDVKVEEPFQTVVDILSTLVKGSKINNLFMSNMKSYGQRTSKTLTEDKKVINYNHFYTELPTKCVSHEPNAIIGKASTNKDVFKRGLEELTLESLETTLDLIDDKKKPLYRGKEYKRTVEKFMKLKKQYELIKDTASLDIFIWEGSTDSSSLIRSTVIGTLLIDLSNGVDLLKAVNAFEYKIDPSRMMRTTAPVSAGMRKQALELIQKEGCEESLHRRRAQLTDVSINNVLFADRTAAKVMKGSLEDLLLGDVKDTKVNSQTEDISIEDFMENIVPQAASMDLLVENKHIPNFVSLTAPIDEESKNIFKWNNKFAWGYSGDVTDSLKARVEELGGRTDGVVRFTHSWNYDKPNQSLMDLHVFMPNCGYSDHVENGTEIHNLYPSEPRVGWNKRKDNKSGGVQDVDFVDRAVDKVPVENITFPSLARLPDGPYYFKIHNWNLRSPTKGGFKAEIDLLGNLYQYEYDKPLKHHEWITVAKAILKDGAFTIEHMLPHGETPINKWGISTKEFVRVESMMLSPNFWDGQEIGNKHYMFMLEGCISPDETRGFYNEYLSKEYHGCRKAFDMLGDKLKCAPADNQLSGVGFSCTKKNDIVCRVKGNINKTFNIKF